MFGQRHSILLSTSVIEDNFFKAVAAWEAGKHKLAFRILSEAVRKGDTECLHNLGYFYDIGIGTAVDKQAAMKYYRRAFKKGGSAAANNIAILYREQKRYKLSFR